MIRFGDVPYVLLRVLRRHCFPVAIPPLVRGVVPWMRENAGVRSHDGTANLYAKYLAPRIADWPRGRTILEIGIGETNSSAYEHAARGAEFCHAFEPFVPLRAPADAGLLARCAAEHGVPATSLAAKVQRMTATTLLAAQSIDCVLSNSVLEHVSDMDALAAELRRVLRPDGCMVHIVDYRDHFFAYPYHHLLWSDPVWSRFLNPGDLPRWRIGDHLDAFARHGFSTEVLLAKPVEAEFGRVENRIHPRFRHYGQRDLSTAFGVLFCRVSGRP